MSEFERFGRLIETVYDAAMDDAHWQASVRLIADILGVHSTVVQVRDATGSVELLGGTDNFMPDLLQEYVQHYYKCDPWAEATLRFNARDLDQVYLGEQWVPAQAVSRSEFSDFARRADIHSLAWGSLDLGQGCIGMLGVHGGLGAKPFDNGALASMRLLLPHLKRVMQVRRTLQEQAINRDMAMGALDAVTRAVIVVEEDAKLLYANAAGDALLRSGSQLRILGGRVHAAAPKHAEVLTHRIRQACSPSIDIRDGPYCGVVPLSRPGQSPSFVTIVRMPVGNLGVMHGPLAMLLIAASESGERRVPHPDALRAVFRLSQAEAELACQLAAGHSVKEIALRRGISLNTARTQLKMALYKTGARRQSDLVAVVLELC